MIKREIKKKHHYIPQSYLKNFCNDDGRIYVYDTESNTVREQSKKGTFHAYKYYSFDTSKYDERDPAEVLGMLKVRGWENVDTSNVDNHVNMVEDLLGEIESEASLVIDNILRKETIDSIEKKNLATHIAMMFVRNPKSRDKIEEIDLRQTKRALNKMMNSDKSLKEFLRRLEKKRGTKISMKEMRSIHEERKDSIFIPQELNIFNMLLLALELDIYYAEKRWDIFVNKESFPDYVTTDFPVSIFSEKPLSHQDIATNYLSKTKVVFPLSKDALLVIDCGEDDMSVYRQETLDQAFVRLTNESITKNKKRYIVCSSQEQCESYIK